MGAPTARASLSRGQRRRSTSRVSPARMTALRTVRPAPRQGRRGGVGRARPGRELHQRGGWDGDLDVHRCDRQLQRCDRLGGHRPQKADGDGHRQRLYRCLRRLAHGATGHGDRSGGGVALRRARPGRELHQRARRHRDLDVHGVHRNYIDADRHGRPSSSPRPMPTVDVIGYTRRVRRRRARRDRARHGRGGGEPSPGSDLGRELHECARRHRDLDVHGRDGTTTTTTASAAIVITKADADGRR